MMRALPGMTVVAPADPVETRLATRAIANHPGPCYLRLGKAGEPVVHQAPPDFTLGRAIALRQGGDLTLISTGGMLKHTLETADQLRQSGIMPTVLSMHTVKPLDVEAVRRAAAATPAIITVEEHSVTGGLGSAVADVLAEYDGHRPRFRKFGIPDKVYHEVGSQSYMRRLAGDLAEMARRCAPVAASIPDWSPCNAAEKRTHQRRHPLLQRGSQHPRMLPVRESGVRRAIAGLRIRAYLLRQRLEGRHRGRAAGNRRQGSACEDHRQSRNFGPFRSLFNGLLSTRGDAVVVFLPADLQDPPEVIVDFMEKRRQGYEVVFGIRKVREESLLMRTIRRVYYRTVSRLANIEIPVDVGEFQLVDRKVIDVLRQCDDYYPYIRGMIASCGFRSTGVEYTWKARKRGLSRNRFYDLIDQGLNGLVSFTNVPLRLCMFFGFSVAILSFIYALFSVVLNLVYYRQLAKPGIPTLIVAVFFFSGLQLFFFGFLGEYIGAIHSQVRKRPLVVERERINFDPPAAR